MPNISQNKNWRIVTLWHNFITEQLFESIENCFLMCGHTLYHLTEALPKYKKGHCPNTYTSGVECVI
jgi:hypothetical protein